MQPVDVHVAARVRHAGVNPNHSVRMTGTHSAERIAGSRPASSAAAETSEPSASPISTSTQECAPMAMRDTPTSTASAMPSDSPVRRQAGAAGPAKACSPTMLASGYTAAASIEWPEMPV